MMPTRVVWFAVGTAAGLYASAKARRAAYRLSMPGLIDQAEAMAAGAREFRREVRDGMAAKERELRLSALAGPAAPTAPEPLDIPAPLPLTKDPT